MLQAWYQGTQGFVYFPLFIIFAMYMLLGYVSLQSASAEMDRIPFSDRDSAQKEARKGFIFITLGLSTLVSIWLLIILSWIFSLKAIGRLLKVLYSHVVKLFSALRRLYTIAFGKSVKSSSSSSSN